MLSWSFFCGWSRSFTWLWPRIIILRVGLAFVCPLNWTFYFLVVFVSSVVHELSHIFDLGPVFPFQLYFKFCTGLWPRKRSFRVFLYLRRSIFFVFLFALWSVWPSGFTFLFRGSPGINFRCYRTLLFWMCIILGGRWNSFYGLRLWLSHLVLGFYRSLFN